MFSFLVQNGSVGKNKYASWLMKNSKAGKSYNEALSVTLDNACKLIPDYKLSRIIVSSFMTLNGREATVLVDKNFESFTRYFFN